MKKILLSSAIVLCAIASQASYLAWQVNSDDVADTSLVYNRASIYAINDNGRTLLNSVDYNGVDVGNSIGAPMDTPMFADLGDDKIGDGYSYYIELSNYSGSVNSFVAGMATPTPYTSLTASITSKLPTAGNLANVNAWHGGGYTAAPEPTSAILMLFGAAMLGLKRKNRSLN